MRYYSYVYIIVLLFIAVMLYEVLTGKVEGFEHKGGSFIPDRTIDPEIAKPNEHVDSITNSISITYNIAEILAKVLIMMPYNFINNFIKMITDFIDYIIEVIKPLRDLASRMLTMVWDNAKKIYLQCVAIFKQYTTIIRKLPDMIKKYADIMVNFIQKIIDKLKEFFDNFFTMLEDMMDKLIGIPNMMFGMIDQVSKIGFNMFEMAMKFPESGLNMVLNLQTKGTEMMSGGGTSQMDKAENKALG